MPSIPKTMQEEKQNKRIKALKHTVLNASGPRKATFSDMFFFPDLALHLFYF
jgi:hypothetical protein